MKIFDGIPTPANSGRGGRPSDFDLTPLGIGQVAFVAIAAGVEPAKMLERVKGQTARWRKSPGRKEARAEHKFTVALGVPPDDPMGTQHVGIWRTA